MYAKVGPPRTDDETPRTDETPKTNETPKVEAGSGSSENDYSADFRF